MEMCQYFYFEFLKADVIVNSTGYQMSLKDGKVATALLNKAGYALQNECTRRAPLNVGDVIVTEGYGLECDKVLHVNCPQWQRSTGQQVSGHKKNGMGTSGRFLNHANEILGVMP